MKKFLILLLAALTLLPAAAPAEMNPLPGSFAEAVALAGEDPAVGGDETGLAVVSKQDGIFIRQVTLLDDRAKELYAAALASENPGPALEVFDAYAWSLPLSYTEAIGMLPEAQEELDALSGQTVGSLQRAGFTLTASGGSVGEPVIVSLSRGFFEYDFEAETTFEEYLALEEANNLDTLTVKNGKYAGFSPFATDLNLKADGTYIPDEEESEPQ